MWGMKSPTNIIWMPPIHDVCNTKYWRYIKRCERGAIKHNRRCKTLVRRVDAKKLRASSDSSLTVTIKTSDVIESLPMGQAIRIDAERVTVTSPYTTSGARRKR